MSSRIPRHDFPVSVDPNDFLKEVDADYLAAIDESDGSAQSLRFEAFETLHAARLHLIFDPEAAKLETWEAVVASMQVHSAMFAAAVAPPGSTIECMIAHKVRTLPATGVHFQVNAPKWITAFWLAVICRDQDRMTQLSQVPLSLLRESGSDHDEFFYDWVDALQTYWLERPGLGDKLGAAFSKSHPSQCAAPADLVLKILSTPIDMFYRFLSRDPDAFNASLVQALELHKEYWTRGEERSKHTDGVLALGPLAIACLGYDAGRPIEVESEYIPRQLLRRSWVGEFPV